MRGSMTGSSAGSLLAKRQFAAVGLFQEMTGEADHIADAGHGGDLAQDNMKVEIVARRIAFVIKLQGRAAARCGFVAVGLGFERHRDDRMVLIIFADAGKFMDDWNTMGGQCRSWARCPKA